MKKLSVVNHGSNGIWQTLSQYIVLCLMALMLFACASNKYNYNPNEFTLENYQKNLNNAVDAPDMLNDLDNIKTANTSLNATDLSTLVQADFLYNQAEYIKAYPLYKNLALKYRDPKIIYKAIVCLDHFEVAPIQVREQDELTNLLIKEEPDSKLSKLFQIKQAIQHGDLNLAETNLNYLVDRDKDTSRSIFLFLSSVFSDTNTKYPGMELKQFANYTFNKYKDKYPEASLMVALSYANIVDLDDLNKTLNYIEINYPNWHIPLYWSLNVLLRKHELPDVIKISHDKLGKTGKVDAILQNIYVAALLNNKDLVIANDYLLGQLKNGSNDKQSILISLGIIAAESETYSKSIFYFKQAINGASLKDDILRISIATMLDYQNHPESAIMYYKAITNTTILPLQQILLLNDYAGMKDYACANALLDKIILGLNMTNKNTLLLKSAYYASINDYNEAYNILLPKAKLYLSDKEYLYQYASMLSMLHKTKEAIYLYKKYITLNPTNAYGYNDLAYIYADQTNNYKLAEKYANKAYMILPADPMILDTKGWIYYKEKDYEKALVYIKKAYDLSLDPDVAKHLIQVYNSLNQPQKAESVKVFDVNIMNMAARKIILEKMLKILMYIEYGSK